MITSDRGRGFCFCRELINHIQLVLGVKVTSWKDKTKLKDTDFTQDSDSHYFTLKQKERPLSNPQPI